MWSLHHWLISGRHCKIGRQLVSWCGRTRCRWRWWAKCFRFTWRARRWGLDEWTRLTNLQITFTWHLAFYNLLPSRWWFWPIPNLFALWYVSCCRYNIKDARTVRTLLCLQLSTHWRWWWLSVSQQLLVRSYLNLLNTGQWLIFVFLYLCSC